MNFLKRAVLSIARRPGKSLILFLVILIIGNLIAGTVAVRQATSQSEEIAKRSLGANVSIGIDDQALMKAYEAGEEPVITGPSAELIEELGARPEVRRFDYTLTTSLISRSLKNYQPEDGSVGMVMGPGGEEEAAYFNLRGTRYAPILLIEEGKLSLTEGRVFTEEDITEGRLVTVIPDMVAETNGLHVGDTIVLTNEIQNYAAAVNADTGEISEADIEVADSHDVALEVIGIFTLNSGAIEPSADDETNGNRLAIDQAAMAESELYYTLYVPIKVAQTEDEFINEGYRRLAEENGEPWADDKYQPYYTPLYLLNSIDDLEGFEQAATERLPQYYRVLSAQSQYEQVAAPIEDIQRIVGVGLVVAVIAALVIISLVVVLFLRDRRREFGIYLSLGVRKPAVMGQVLIEVLIVAAVALVIALFTGNLISGGISQQMIDGQLAAQEEQLMYGASASYVYYGGDASLLMQNLSLEDVLEDYQVGLSVPYVLTFLGLGLGCVVLSCIAPLLYVLNLKPKKILM
ncbi:MAG: ABC transporter permease [Coriobacteriales bacterium]|jgi:putative ABC transport system permease protein|nr:ABC transporter permease [Coriobacteriales bacterium]